MKKDTTPSTQSRKLSISVPEDVIRQIDAQVKRQQAGSRSAVITEVLRASFTDERARRGRHPVAGVLSIVYDHHSRNLQQQLTRIQHDFGPAIVSTMHVHLDHHRCLESLAVRGRMDRIQTLADRLRNIRGILRVQLAIGAVEEK